LFFVGSISAWSPELEQGFDAVSDRYFSTTKSQTSPSESQGFMLSMGLAKMNVDALTGKPVPDYFGRLSLEGDGLPEKAFK